MKCILNFLNEYWSQIIVVIGFVTFIIQQTVIWSYKKQEKYYDRYRPIVDEFLNAIFEFENGIQEIEVSLQPSPEEMDNVFTKPAIKLANAGSRLCFYSDKTVCGIVSDIKNLTSNFIIEVTTLYRWYNSNPGKYPTTLRDYMSLRSDFFREMDYLVNQLSSPIKNYLKN